MKSLTVLSMGILMISTAAFANGKVVASCTNGEELNVKIIQVSRDLYRADVTEQSFGDSYPTFHFKNVRLAPRDPRIMGAPTEYNGRGFSISIGYDASTAPAVLNVPSLDIKDANLNCR